MSDSPGSAAPPPAWKLTLPCTRAEAEAIAVAEPDLTAVLITSEVDEAADQWRLDAYFDGEPTAAAVAAVRALAPSGGRGDTAPQPMADEDWVTMSQAGLEPIREGRFVVHTDAFPAEPPPGGRALLVNAGRAFGTGHHHTTAGCLAMLDGLADRAVTNAIDLGTGTGLLALAARHLWPGARVTATDIDPIAIEVTRANMALNAVATIDLIVADGARDPAIAAGVPYDLIVANILAGPLIAMAAEIAAIAEPGATIVLAGLLRRQAREVVDAYIAQGCVVAAREERGDWTILRLARTGQASGATSVGDRDGWERDV